jgi:hypothetical protein
MLSQILFTITFRWFQQIQVQGNLACSKEFALLIVIMLSITFRWFWQILLDGEQACSKERGVWFVLSFANCDQIWSFSKRSH